MMKNVRIIFLIFPFIFCMSSHAMDESQKSKILTKDMQIVHALINTFDLDHAIICSLAVNKQTEKWLREKALCRKEYLRKHIYHQILFEDTSVTWHKYGSACGRKIVNDSEVGHREIMLMVYYMQQNISYKCNIWNISYKDVLRDNRTFFNEDGNICCYGLELPNRIGLFYLGSNQHVVQYCLPQHGKAYEDMLGLEIAPNYCRPLSQFISFPILLNALLQTKKTKGGAFQVCNIKDVIIPDDYKKCNSCDEYKKFEDLPEKIQKAFDKTYHIQQRRDGFMSAIINYK